MNIISDSMTPFLCAAKSGNLNALNLLLAQGANKDAHNEHGLNALHIAALYGHIPIISALINDHGFDPNCLTTLDTKSELNYRETPLHCAAFMGHIDAIDALIKNGAHKDARNVLDLSVLHKAAQGGKGAAVLSLINDHGFDPNEKCQGRTPLHRLAAYGGSVEEIMSLISAGADPHALDEDSRNALFYAAWRNNIPVLVSLIKEYDLDLNTLDEYGRSVFQFAVDNGACVSQLTLQSMGAHTTHKLQTLGCLAGLKVESEKKETLIEALLQGSLTPWNPNSTDPNISKLIKPATPLIKAVEQGCLNCVKLLLADRRTDTNIQDAFRKSALHYAVENWALPDPETRLSICSLLLNLQRTDLSLRDRNGRTALETVRHKKEDRYYGEDKEALLQKFFNLFALRKLKVQLFLSLKNARCSEQCSAQECTHVPRLPADLCLKIARMLTVESLLIRP